VARIFVSTSRPNEEERPGHWSRLLVTKAICHFDSNLARGKPDLRTNRRKEWLSRPLALDSDAFTIPNLSE
jgi:hypothetical protein